MTEPLSTRAYESALHMHEADSRMPRPKPEDYTHLDTAAATVQPAEPEQPAAPMSGPGWDTSAFDQLPAETQSAVMAGTAAERGRTFLEVEAERELVRAGDVHLHLTDPGKYIDRDGRVDRAAIRNDVAALVRERPELSRFGNRPGQEPARPDDRRHSAPGSGVGAGGVPADSGAAPSYLAMMEAATGVKFAPWTAHDNAPKGAPAPHGPPWGHGPWGRCLAVHDA